VKKLDAVIVGAGFAGVYMLHRLRGLGLEARVFEAGSGIGGTWFWNRYPGARCDIESMEYSYQFSEELQQDWEWTERYATQPEILRYVNHVADRFGLRDGIQLNTRVESARYDESEGRWTVETDGGETYWARFCVMATGCLSSTNRPDFPGLDSFEGETYHTGAWPHEGVDFSGKRVGVIGTGSSAIQSIPLIAEQAELLTVFQRTPNYSIPAHNQPLDPAQVAKIKAEYPEFRARNAQSSFGASFGINEELAAETSPEALRGEYEKRWEYGGLPFLGAYGDLLFDAGANETAQDFIRSKIRELVDDPAVAELLSPDTVVGCKRLCVDTNYYATYNQPHVKLVDVSENPIERITPKGLRTAGVDHEFDAIVFATGFDAMTGALDRIDIRGRTGQRLKDKWSAGPRTYLGLMVAGFPNLFTITGPGSPSVLSNMLPSIEQHVNWIADCVAFLNGEDLSVIEAQTAAEDAWVDHVNEVADETLFRSCNSWYVGANVPGKPRVFTPYLGYADYVEKCDDVVAKRYEGFELG
jgi:cyclohexanone monooxygenase